MSAKGTTKCNATPDDPWWLKSTRLPMLDRAARSAAVGLSTLALVSMLGSERAAAQEDVVAKLGILTAGHEYAGLVYPRREIIRKVYFEQGFLGLRVDDAGESAPVTVLIPLREIVEVGPGERGGVYLACAGGVTKEGCVLLTREDFSSAAEKLSKKLYAQLKYTRRGGFLIGCEPAACRDITRAIAALTKTARALPMSNQSREVAPPAAQRPSDNIPNLIRQINSSAARVNRDLEFLNKAKGEHGRVTLDLSQSVAYDPRSATLSIDTTTDSRIQVASNPRPTLTNQRKSYSIPLREVQVIYEGAVRYKVGDADTVYLPAVDFVCENKRSCITYIEGNAPARRDASGHIECNAAQCGALREDIKRLMALVPRDR